MNDLSQHPSTHYRGESKMDLTFPIRWVIPEKDLIDWGQDTALRQNINFSNSIVCLQEQMQAGWSKKTKTYE